MQMVEIGILSNYKREYQRNWQWCMAIMGLSILLLIANAYIYSTHVSNKICLVAVFAIIHFALIQPSVVYSVLLYSLYKRFFALNSFLRLVKWIILSKVLTLAVEKVHNVQNSKPIASVKTSLFLWKIWANLNNFSHSVWNAMTMHKQQWNLWMLFKYTGSYVNTYVCEILIKKTLLVAFIQFFNKCFD